MGVGFRVYRNKSKAFVSCQVCEFGPYRQAMGAKILLHYSVLAMNNVKYFSHPCLEVKRSTIVVYWV